MPNEEEIAIIQGIRSGGNDRRRFENLLWKKFFGFIHWGMNRYKLTEDDARHSYDDTICCVITNIVSGKYEGEGNALLKTYIGTIFHNKCVDRLRMNKAGKRLPDRNIEMINPENRQPVKESLLEKLPDQVKNAMEKIIEKEEQVKAKKCLEKIGEACKELLRLYVASYKDSEIAALMNYSSADVVKQTRYRCMEKLGRYYLNMYQYE